jgi:dTDP-4-amino-4,6-dideoxygalactose transaminase
LQKPGPPRTTTGSRINALGYNYRLRRISAASAWPQVTRLDEILESPPQVAQATSSGS